MWSVVGLRGVDHDNRRLIVELIDRPSRHEGTQASEMEPHIDSHRSFLPSGTAVGPGLFIGRTLWLYSSPHCAFTVRPEVDQQRRPVAHLFRAARGAAESGHLSTTEG